MTQTVLVLAAHPDDEVLGCGGTIAKLADTGVLIHVAFFADGVNSRSNNNFEQDQELLIRKDCAKRANELLGVKSISFCDFPDNQMDTISLLEVVKSVEELIKKYSPDTVFTHHSGDVNIDHQILHEAVVVACRPQNKHPVKSILSFEVPSSTEWQLPNSVQPFTPNWFVDISNTLDRKLAALNIYSHELREWPHPRSLRGVKHLAHWRGATIGVDAAESFILGRHIT